MFSWVIKMWQHNILTFVFIILLGKLGLVYEKTIIQVSQESYFHGSWLDWLTSCHLPRDATRFVLLICHHSHTNRLPCKWCKLAVTEGHLVKQYYIVVCYVFSYGYVFALCEHIGCGAWTASHAEGVLLAADESDGRALHFEGGLPVTALILSTISRYSILLYASMEPIVSPFLEETLELVTLSAD